jgi:CheY-like chemotaxis protein
VVEDNHDVRTVAVELLEQLGYRTIAVESAAAALEALDRGRKPDLVFSDVVLPGELNGLALARRIRERFPELPVLLTTGYAKALGPRPDFHVLRKPYQISALGRAVRNAIDSTKLVRTVRAS